MEGQPERGANLRDLESLRITRPPPRRRHTATRVVIAALVTLPLLGFGAYEAYLHTVGRPLVVQTAQVVVTGPEQAGIVLTGAGYVVTRANYITVGTKILGRIVSEPVEIGQRVRKGQLLAQIDDGDYRAQLNGAQAKRDQTAADVVLKDAQLRRIRKLFSSRIISRDQLDIAVHDDAVAHATLKAADAAVAYARFEVNECRIVAPIDGVVLQKYRDVGDTINYGGEIQAGGGATDIVQLADTDDMRAEVDVSENDIAQVHMEMPATIVLDAYPQRSFEATVVRIYPEADRQKGTIRVEARFIHPDLRVVRPEMSARVSFLAEQPAESAAPMVLVPAKAIVGSGAKASVWIVRDGTVHRRAVVLGAKLEDGVEVNRGLAGGETVITNPSLLLRDGEAVAESSNAQ